MFWLYKLGRLVCRFVFRLSFSVHLEGTENIPTGKRPYLVVCNHCHNIDPMILAFAVKPVICYLAKAELHRTPLLHWIFERMGTVPVERGRGDTSALEICAQRFAEGSLIGIFPEGTRHPVGEPGRPKSGMALIARMTGADVLPCAIVYEEPMRFRSRITMRYGALIPHAALALDDDSPRALKCATKRVWDDVLKMTNGDTEPDGGA